MVKLGSTDLESLGLVVSGVSGLYGWPEMKTEGTDWSDEHYSDYSTRKIDYQYKERKITLDCFVSADDWETLAWRMNAIAQVLRDEDEEGLRMLLMPSLSNRGYLVRVTKSTVFSPCYYFQNGKSVATFKIQFEEPQPFNVQFYWLFEANANVVLSLDILNLNKQLSPNCTDQKFITIYLGGGYTFGVNLEQEDFHYYEHVDVVAGIPIPVIITGNIDSITDIDIVTTQVPSGIDTADRFLRNGNITYTPEP